MTVKPLSEEDCGGNEVCVPRLKELFAALKRSAKSQTECPVCHDKLLGTPRDSHVWWSKIEELFGPLVPK